MLRAAIVGVVLMTTMASADGVGMAGAPMRVIATGASGNWVVMCQARNDTNKDGRLDVEPGFNGTYGDQQRAYLVIGTGVGEPIDDFVVGDPTQRRAVIERKNRVVLIQPGLGKDIDLGTVGVAPISFDSTGDRLVFSRKRAGKDMIVIRDVVTGKERFLDPGPGKLDSVYLHPGDSWIEVMVFAMKKGDQPWHTTGEPGHGWCWTGATSDFIQQSGTPPVRRYLSTDGKSLARELPDLVGIGGDQLFQRTADGAITSERPGEQPHAIVPASCGARAIGMHDGALVVACTKRGTPAPLEEYASDGTQRKINATMTPSDADSTEDIGRFLLVTGRDANDTIIDLVTGTVRHSPEYQQPISHEGDHALVQRGEQLVVIDPTSERVLGQIEKYPETLVAGTFTYVEPLVVDRKGYTVVGTAPARASTSPMRGTDAGTIAAVANDGRILVGWGSTYPHGEWPLGRLEWVAPVKPAP